MQEKLLARLDRAEPGTYVIYTHPAYDTEETRRPSLPGAASGAMAKERAADLELVTSADLQRALEQRSIRLIRYDEV